jgi:DNA-binding MarR family transcriptional regulator
MTDGEGRAWPAEPGQVAARLRHAVGDLVRATRGQDVLAPVLAAVLDLLDRDGPLTTAELAARRQVRHQTMAANVGELRDLGYLNAAPHPADGRMRVLTLTAAGRAALEADRAARVHRLAGALERSLSGEEAHDLARAIALIERVTAAVAAGGDHGQPPVTGDW